MKDACITILRKTEAASELKWKNNSELLANTLWVLGEKCEDYVIALLFSMDKATFKGNEMLKV